jgi:hypothetical protein
MHGERVKKNQEVFVLWGAMQSLYKIYQTVSQEVYESIE